jgi:Uma2 family endonuclease
MQVAQEVVYPDTDGKPMADNTKQARWIFILYGNLCALFRNNPNVFVAADNLWYPVQGDPACRVAPDIYVVFGRPKGDRGSYKQWEEAGIPLTVAFAVTSPGNTWREMADKRDFYDEHGVEEYYVYDPDADELFVYLRGPKGAAMRREYFQGTFTSPRLGVRFDTTGDELRVYHPDGSPLLTFEELEAAREAEAARAEAEAARAEAAEKRANLEAARAEEAERHNRRLSRIVELLTKAASGPLPPDELAELESPRTGG